MDASALASAESWLSLISKAKFAAAFLVAPGVAIQFLGDWISIPFEKTVKMAREEEIVGLQADIANANAREKIAELELEQLRKLAGPRDINFETFRKEMEGKPKAHVQIASRLRVALGISGWEVEDPNTNTRA